MTYSPRHRFFSSLASGISILLLSGVFVGCGSESEPDQTKSPANEGMVLIPGGSFSMGGDPGLMGGGSQSHGSSYPIHDVTLDAFWIDETEVTNRQFAEFVEATGYVTFAERPLPRDYVEQLKEAAESNIRELEALSEQASGRDREAILASIERIREAAIFGKTAGAIVFAPPEDEIYGQYDYTQWWRILPEANWRQPEGAGSTWIGREDHPVVNVTREDALAYAKWAGKRLPTEAEWERAARGGLNRNPYVWGDDFAPKGEDIAMANIWQGVWPYENTGADGFILTSPIRSFSSNAYGLYDMAGNVWEITADRYHPETYATRFGRSVVNPIGPSLELLASYGGRSPAYVTRGGSFLCSDDWCRGYQPGSRQSMENDSPANHTGFRCARDAASE